MCSFAYNRSLVKTIVYLVDRITAAMGGRRFALFITLLMVAVSPAWATKHAKPVKPAPSLSRYTTYKLMDGTIVEMSPTQKLIANGFCQHLTPVELYRFWSPIVVTITSDLGENHYVQGTGVIFNENTILTNWHVVRGAKNIVAWDYNGAKYENGRLANLNPS